MADEPDELFERFAKYVDALGTEEEDNASHSLAEGREMVENFIGSYTVPPATTARAIIEVAAELFHHKLARSGVTDFGGTDLQPFRIARDPMKAAYPILTQFVPAGLA